MVLAVIDRGGHQFGLENAEPDDITHILSYSAFGDILFAANDGNDNFSLEDNAEATSGLITVGPTAGADNGQGPGNGEFFFEDFGGDGFHADAVVGGLAILRGSDEVMVNQMDLFGVFNGGTVWHSTQDGSRSRAFTVYGDDTPGAFGKGAGLGDLELFCAVPIEIGDRVWFDTDGDGIQDPDENGIGGVEVTLTVAGTTVTTTTATIDDPATAWNDIGTYYFNGEAGGNADGVLVPGANITLSIDTTQAALSDYDLTIENSDGDTSNNRFTDLRDSDATLNGDIAEITFTAGAAGENNHTFDFGFTALGAIGNYVWVDENSDGYQDEGEPGIPNVTVNLYDSEGTLVATTVTDSHGGYLFSDLLFGEYFVDVADGTGNTISTVPAGMTQTDAMPIPANSDFGNQAHTSAIPNGGGLTGYPAAINESAPENLTADFGYNYNPSTDVNNTTNNAALGDRVWIDLDGDGAQDPNEIGVEGATVSLFHDPEGDGTYTTPYAPNPTTTTDANGYYIFDDLPPGAYVVTVTDDTGASHDILNAGNYSQTGDPDHFGTTGMNNDNTTTTPVVLGPGDVFLNADFGYQPGGATLGSIGDTVFFDADADGNGPSLAPVDGGGAVTQGAGGTADATDYGIAGVTVSLIQDSNGNGVWDANEPIIATDTTDENGQYLFDGLPITDGDGTDDYLVWVNDTDNILDGLTPTYDRDGLAPNSGVESGLGISAVTNLVGDDRDQDFGYSANTPGAGLGAIGDTVWFDINNSGTATQDVGEPGIEGVVIVLTDASGNTQTTTTDENGHYYFGNLPLDTTYTVTVAAENFAAGGVLEGMTQTYDEDAPTNDNESMTTLTPANPIDLNQDFSYVSDQGSIGNLVWEDLNADGNVDAGEAGIAGVTIDLYRDLNGNDVVDPGEPLMGTETTDASGNYLFDNLPLGNYIVDVTDEAGVLNGYWHSLGNQDATTNAGNDAVDESKADPFVVTIDAAIPDNRNVDFGYYLDPAAVGNVVFRDLNNDGDQDAGEPGIAGVAVTLIITYPDGTVISLNTTTDSNGNYGFGNLLLDEDFDGIGTYGSGGDEPSHVISVTAPTGLDSTYDGIADTVGIGNGTDVNADDDAGEAAFPPQGGVDLTNDFGYNDTVVADVNLTKVVNDTTPNVGDTVTFTIVVTNEGPNAATNVDIQDTVPAGYNNIRNISSGGSATGNVINWTIASLPATAGSNSVTLTFDATVLTPTGTVGQYINVATVMDQDQTDSDSTPGDNPDTNNDGNIGSQDDGDPNDAEDPQDQDDSDDAEARPQVGADVNLTKVVNNTTPNVGDTVTFTIVVTNEGPDEATNVDIQDTVPAGYGNISNLNPNGMVTNNVINWTIASLPAPNNNAPGSNSVTLTFQATVLAPTGATGEYINVATVLDQDQVDSDSTPGDTPDTNGDGNIGSQDDGDPNDAEDPQDQDDSDDAQVTPSSTPLPIPPSLPPENIPVLGLWAQALFALLLGLMVHFRKRLSNRKKT